MEVTYDDEINNVIAYAFENKYRYATWHLDEASVRVYFEKNLMSETIFNGDQFVSKRQVFRQDPKTGTYTIYFCLLTYYTAAVLGKISTFSFVQ